MINEITGKILWYDLIFFLVSDHEETRVAETARHIYWKEDLLLKHNNDTFIYAFG